MELSARYLLISRLLSRRGAGQEVSSEVEDHKMAGGRMQVGAVDSTEGRRRLTVGVEEGMWSEL